MNKKPVGEFSSGAVYDLYRGYGIVPDELSHLSKEQLSFAMLEFLVDSTGAIGEARESCRENLRLELIAAFDIYRK